MKGLTIFWKSVKVILVIDYLLIICDLLQRYTGNKVLASIFNCTLALPFFSSVLLLPILMLVIFMMPWREEWLKLRWRLTMSFFLDLAFVWYILGNYGE